MLAAACEACYRGREKCSFDQDQPTCRRCLHLRRPCMQRKKKRMGRIPAVKFLPKGAQTILNLDSLPSPRSPAVELAHTKSLHIRNPTYPPYRQLAAILENKSAFLNAHRHFIIGESFVDEFRGGVALIFRHSPYLLADAYHTILSLLCLDKSKNFTFDNVDLSLASRCLRALSDVGSSISGLNDAALIMMVGQILLAYNAMLPFRATTRHITQATLWAVKDWYPLVCERPSLAGFATSLVFVDTVECLFRREPPVVRMPEIKCVVDRLMGVSTSLLPLLYDLAKQSHIAKATSYETLNLNPNGQPGDIYSSVEEQISVWEPTIPEGFSEMYAPTETTIMTHQARSYRLTALLIIHRLRYPLGTEDDKGRSYAKGILEELSPFKSWPSHGATGLGLDFPLLVAMVELPDEGKEIFRAFEPLRYRSSRYGITMKFLKSVHDARMRGYQGLWFDLVDDHLLDDCLP